jgi:tetratricopeptide (TPR) repeat protein
MGVARLERNEVDVAIVHLERSVSLDGKRTRARAPLQLALNRAAVVSFSARAYARQALGDDATTLRNLGGVRLLAGNADGAIAPLEKSAALAADPRTLALLGRAYKQTGKLAPAAGALRQALKLLGDDDPHAHELRVDLAAVLLADGHENEALQVIGPALADKDAGRRARALDAFVVAGRATATEHMRVGAFERAFSLLEDVEEKLGKNAEQAVAVRCDLALAATGAGLRDTALRRLAELERDKAVCPFVPPADKLAVPILIAWNEGATPAGAERALRRLDGLRKLATGAARPLVREAARFIALRAAAELFGKNPGKARGFLARAVRYEDSASPETIHNQAAFALEDGNLDTAIAGLESVADIVPEASVNLGIAWERKGDQQKALAYFRKAAAAGARFAPLKRWLAIKERIWAGGAP